MTPITDELAAALKRLVNSLSLHDSQRVAYAKEALAKYEAAKAQEPSDLVKRLRDDADKWDFYGEKEMRDLIREAADRIEALEAGTATVRVLASEAVLRGQEILDYYVREQGWPEEYTLRHAEVFLTGKRSAITAYEGEK